MSAKQSLERVWVFVGQHARFPSGVFRSFYDAEGWIAQHKLSGFLTEYPVGTGVLDWALEHGRFTPKADKVIDADYVSKFTSAYQAHHQYEDGFRRR